MSQPPSCKRPHLACDLLPHNGTEASAEAECALLLYDIVIAEQEIDRGEGVGHDIAKASLLRRIQR